MMPLKPGTNIRPINTQTSFGTQDDEFARVDHVHDIDNDLYAKLSRNSDGNMIDNPEFIITQRNSPTGLSSTVCQFDRWNLQGAGTVNANLSQISTGLPVAPSIKYGGLVTITATDASIAAGDFLGLVQAVEGVTFSEARFGSTLARPVTVSFWARSSIAGTFCVSLRNNTATRSYVVDFALEANVWKLVVVTFPGCIDGTWETFSNVGGRLSIFLSCGTTFHTTPNSWNNVNAVATSSISNLSATNGNTFNITGVKMEIGSYSPYQSKPFQQDLANCLRFLQVYTDPPLRGVIAGGNTANRMGMTFIQRMRVAPVLTATGTSMVYDGTAGGAVSSVATSWITPTHTEHDLVLSVGGFTTGRAACLYNNGNTSTWVYSAELI